MKVNYKKNILEKINESIIYSKTNNKEIEDIELTKKEFHELCNLTEQIAYGIPYGGFNEERFIFGVRLRVVE